MEDFKNNLNRRDFIKYLTASGLGLIYGCSDESFIPTISPGPPLQTTKIALHKTDNRVEGVTKVMELLDLQAIAGKHVVVKPNFNTADPPPASTHNDTLSQLMIEIRDRGASTITLAERSFQPFNEVIEEKAIEPMANDLDFDIKNLETDSYTEYNRTGLHWNNGFRLPDTINNAEYIVSTCCLKTHHTGVITMSLKLSVGILPSMHMTELHNSSSINSMIAEINLAYRPDLIIMDGVKTFITGGPSQGVEADGDVILAGTDRIAIDMVGTAILKDLGSTRVSGKISELEQINRAQELGLGINHTSQIEFITADEASRQYAEKLAGILETEG
jgi:uncharacterized protein (DUF362 family)